ncbi:hypothetical protein DdX_21484 [Ditylenchus destructor]|uniref:Uncharacterized protein n=1 Tax=Ditylenchus destructor TaxID=166010 RepID=A0AAD4MJL1_9BILA|nr:hypothetical protein DdX_21484 [Ditylenchus destructor]
MRRPSRHGDRGCARRHDRRGAPEIDAIVSVETGAIVLGDRLRPVDQTRLARGFRCGSCRYPEAPRGGCPGAQGVWSASANVRWQKALKDEAHNANDIVSFAYGWTQEVADALGFNKRTIERDLLLYRRLAPSLVARLREQPPPILANASQLRALAKLDEAEQVSIVDQLTAAEPAKSVSEAQARMRGANRVASDPTAKNLSAFLGAFSRMSLTRRRGAARAARAAACRCPKSPSREKARDLRPLLPAMRR